MKEYGITFDELKAWGGSITYTNYADGALLISDGHADGIIAVSVPAVVELVRRVDMLWLAPDEAIVDTLSEKYGYAKNLVKKGKYTWAEKDGYTIGEPLVMLARSDVSEETVHSITKAIVEKPEIIGGFGKFYKAFAGSNAWKDLGCDMHPGAARYYKEAGLMK